MISVRNLNHTLRLILFIVLALLIAIAIFVVSTNAQTLRSAPPAQVNALAPDKPIFNNYRGVTIGMPVADAHQKLGTPTESAETQDFYFYSETESAQVFYDAAHKVRAVSVNYLGENAPTPQQVLGVDVAAGPDGSLSKIISYQQAGFWVAYYRSAGPAPIVTVSMQRIVTAQ
jgi:hypothetical protein